ncbi:MAG: cohesin domain-containing protein [Candidatus Omnitrophota bacterium]
MGKRKSILLLVAGFCLCLLAAAAQAQNSAVITVGSNSAYKKTTVTVPVNFNPALDKGVSAVSFHLEYNPAELKFKEAKTGPAALNAEKNVSVNNKGNGVVKFVIFGLNNTVIAKGVLAEVSFDILASAATGKAVLVLSNYSASTPDATAVPLVASNGAIAITDTIVTTASKSQMEEKKIVSEENRMITIAQSPVPEPALPLTSGQTIIVASEYKGSVVQRSGEEGLKPIEKNRDMPPQELDQQYEQQESQPVLPVEQSMDESAKYRLIEEKDNTKQIEKESSLGKDEQAKASEKKVVPEIIVKPVKHLFIWRSYRLELAKESRIMPLSWELSKKQKLPFLLVLDKKNGSIFGIVWGKGEFELKLNIITKDKQFIEVPCKLKIE